MLHALDATTLDLATCAKAVEESDANYDDRFFLGVTSTGIYCRPSCPSRTPKSENRRYFTSVAKARAEGFRACKRCHPDAAVGDEPPARRAAEALELIEAGVVERGGVAALARAMNYSERQLGRLLVAEYGAPPATLSRRIWRAA